MAEIFRATSRGAHGFAKTLVVKRILPEQAANPRFVEWFIDEAKLMMRLDHPKIVQVLDFGEVDGRYYIAMEYVKGIDCLKLLRECARRRWRPSPVIAVHIIADVMDALDYAHNLTDSEGRPLNIVHSDVSPSNIFISDLGEVKLSDFGIATMGGRRGRVESGVVRGKYGYLPPEAVVGLPVDHRGDIFSAGVVLAELLMVQRLFRGESYMDVLMQVRDCNLERLDEFGQHISPDLRQILGYALTRDPFLRYQNALAFRDALHRYLYDRQQLVRSTSVRRFMQRITAPPNSDAQDAITRSAGKRPMPAGVPGALGPSLLHGDRRILLGPPPQPMPVPKGPSRRVALSRLSSGEMLESHGSGSGVAASADEFDLADTLPPLEEAMALPSHATPADSPAQDLPRPAPELPRPTPALECDLAERSLLSLLFELAVEVETGLVVLRAADTVKEIYLVSGDPQYVSSNIPEELFGQFLLAEGVLRAHELRRALDILPRYRGKLGEALVALGMLRPMQVLRLLTHQIRSKVFHAFCWSSGRATFYRDVTCERDHAPLGLDAFELLAAGVAALPDSVLSERLSGAMDRRPRAVRPPRVPPDVFRVGGYPTQVYEHLDGEHTLAELMDEAGHEDASAFAQMTYLLLECGLASLD